jgi:hypothetical protein
MRAVNVRAYRLFQVLIYGVDHLNVVSPMANPVAWPGE